MILGVSAFQLRRKIGKKSVQGRSKIKPQIGWHLDPIFDGSWSQHGWILEGFGGPSWSHVGTKCHQSRTQKSIKKIITLWEASGTNFNEFLVDLGSNLGGPGGSNESVFWWLCWLLEPRCPKTPPRPLQEPHKRPQEPPRAQFWKDFGRFLVDFWLDFWLILVPNLRPGGGACPQGYWISFEY